MSSASDFSRDDFLFGAVGEDILLPGSGGFDPILGRELYDGPPEDEVVWWGDGSLDDEKSAFGVGDGSLFAVLDDEVLAEGAFVGGVSAFVANGHDDTQFGFLDEPSALEHFGFPGAGAELGGEDRVEFAADDGLQDAVERDLMEALARRDHAGDEGGDEGGDGDGGGRSDRLTAQE